MIAKLIRWVLGSHQYSVEGNFANTATRLLIKSGAHYRKLKSTDGKVSFWIARGDSEALSQIFKKHGVEFKIPRTAGLAKILQKYRKRYGILIGAFLFSVIIFSSERFIWNVNVSGCNLISAREVTLRLEELGFGIGTYIPSIDFDKLHNEYLLRFDDTAWIAVNLHGTVANVEVMEAEKPNPALNESLPHNLVAREDGIITYMEILRGIPVVKEDELVRKGQLLASGIEEGKHGFSLVHARGTVLATVKREIKIEVPLTETVIKQTGTVHREKYLNVFGISLKFSGTGGSLPSDYDKIESEQMLRFFDIVEVPISVSEISYYEKSPVVVNYTPEEAKAEAYRRLREETYACTQGGELAGRKITAGLTDNAYVIDCELSVICDIAQKLPILKSDGAVK